MTKRSMHQTQMRSRRSNLSLPLTVTLTFAFTALFVSFLCAEAKKGSVPVNILHITDLHGWVFGHPHNAALNADFGDFTSLIEWMEADAKAKEEELFIFDSGDLIEGTGLSDATDVHGTYILETVKMIKSYDAITLGNHDIGRPDVVDTLSQSFVPFFNGNILSANTILKSNNKTLGGSYYSFQTALGTNVLVLGYLFNFTQQANNTRVVPVAESLKESYFAEAMAIPFVDLIVVVAHIDPSPPSLLEDIFEAIRSYHPKTPLAMLSGHRHITFYKKYDDNAFTIESGKYFEVLGKVRFSLDRSNKNMENFTHTFVKTSKENFYEMSGKSESTFLTTKGASVRKFVNAAFNYLHLNETQGCSPIRYYANRDVSDSSSLYGLYVNEVAPKVIFNNSFSRNPFFIVNTATLRYDLYEGRVNLNDIYTVLPFKDGFFYYTMTGSDLKKTLSAITNRANTERFGHGLTPYFPGVELQDFEAALANSHYYFSKIEIVDQVQYTVILAAYDAQAVGRVLSALFPERRWKEEAYPTDLNSTFSLLKYVNKYFPCSTTCIC